MRLPFVVTCVAGAVCLVSVNSSAGLSNTPTKSALSAAPPRSESSVERHSSAQKLGNNEEERMNPAEAEKALEMLKYRYNDESLEEHLIGGVTPESFIKQLGLLEALEKPPNNLLIDFNLNHWRDFTERYNKHNGLNPIISLRETFLKLHGGNQGDKVFYENLLKARGKAIADDVRRLQKGMSPAEAFIDMGLEVTGDYTLTKPGPMTRWVDYMEAHDKVYPGMATPINDVLKTIRYPEKKFIDVLSTEQNMPRKKSRKGKLLDNLMDSWLLEKLDPAEVAGRLDLLQKAENRAKFLENIRLKTWVEYVKKFNREGGQVSYLSLCTLTNIPIDDMVEMLLRATKSPEIKNVAVDFVKALSQERKDKAGRAEYEADVDKLDRQLEDLYAYGRKRKVYET